MRYLPPMLHSLRNEYLANFQRNAIPDVVEGIARDWLADPKMPLKGAAEKLLLGPDHYENVFWYFLSEQDKMDRTNPVYLRFRDLCETPERL